MVRLLGRAAFPPHGLMAQRFPRHILYDALRLGVTTHKKDTAQRAASLSEKKQGFQREKKPGERVERSEERVEIALQAPQKLVYLFLQ